MIDILFFASIREQLGIGKCSIPLPFEQTSLYQLQQALVSQHGKLWADVLLADNVVKAVNQQVVEQDYQLSDGDEVAFFPPVTGG